MEIAIPLGTVLTLARKARERITKVRVRVHRAVLLGGSGAECYFINVTNRSPSRDVTVTHVWMETNPQVHVMTRPLPVRLAYDQPWETWVEVADLPETGGAEFLARVRLSTGKVIKSRPAVIGKDVPSAGFVPG